MKIWIDDIRTPPDNTWIWITDSKSAIEFLDEMTQIGVWSVLEEISFDHDLGGDDTTRPVVLWMIEWKVRFEKYHVHSANPVGRDWLNGMIERYLK